MLLGTSSLEFAALSERAREAKGREDVGGQVDAGYGLDEKTCCLAWIHEPTT
jgi:hypothetical protein